MKALRRPLFVLGLLGLAAAAEARASGSADTGAVCIAPFHVPSPMGPNMSQTTWPPTSRSRFTFRIDKKLKATLVEDQMLLITGVPADRKVLVEVRLDGKPYESFRLDLRKEPGNRACFWLYEGYWHWGITLWGDERRGCRCKANGPSR